MAGSPAVRSNDRRLSDLRARDGGREASELRRRRLVEALRDRNDLAELCELALALAPRTPTHAIDLDLIYDDVESATQTGCLHCRGSLGIDVTTARGFCSVECSDDARHARHRKWDQERKARETRQSN